MLVRWGSLENCFRLTAGERSIRSLSALEIRMIEYWVSKYGEEYRHVIVDALKFVDEREPIWGVPVDRHEFLDDVIRRLRSQNETMKQEIKSTHFMDGLVPAGGQTYAPGLCIAWQRGPLGRGPDRIEPNGCFVETVIAAAIDRLQHYQAGQFHSKYNAEAIHHLSEALNWLEQRTKDREQREVEGTHNV